VKKLPLLILTLGLLTGCATRNQRILASDQSEVAIRQIQTRAFDTTDKPKTLRTVIATLQDLGFVMDKADQDLGSVSATKLDGYALRITVSVRPRGEKQLAVRANAQYNVTTVDDPEPYQQFFAALEKAMFLTAQQVE
jgi:hypothetical protein